MFPNCTTKAVFFLFTCRPYTIPGADPFKNCAGDIRKAFWIILNPFFLTQKIRSNRNVVSYYTLHELEPIFSGIRYQHAVSSVIRPSAKVVNTRLKEF